MRVATKPLPDDDPEPGLDYRLCTVPGSRLQFRGPLPDRNGRFIAVLGGIETFGKYVREPYPSLLSDWTGLPVANLGVAQAGLSLFSEEDVLLDFASEAELTVFQVLGAQNMSNRLYTVHPRRNDRFLGVSPALREIFPDVDFTEINFTGHLLNTLKSTSESAFGVVVDELKWAWVQRMRRILSRIRGKVVLVRIADPARVGAQCAIEGGEPHFVDKDMIDRLRPAIDRVVDVPLDGDPSLEGKVVPLGEEDAALTLPGPADHQRIAEALAPVVADLVGVPGRASTAARARDQSFSISSGTAVNKSATRP